jgi:acyl carrier protein
MGYVDEQVREIVREHGRLRLEVSDLGRDADLYDAGMTSHASVGVMLALEERFEVEFPEQMLTPSTFSSIAAISGTVDELLARQAA